MTALDEAGWPPIYVSEKEIYWDTEDRNGVTTAKNGEKHQDHSDYGDLSSISEKQPLLNERVKRNE